jgi:hypothetical protein
MVILKFLSPLSIAATVYTICFCLFVSCSSRAGKVEADINVDYDSEQCVIFFLSSEYNRIGSYGLAWILLNSIFLIVALNTWL